MNKLIYWVNFCLVGVLFVNTNVLAGGEKAGIENELEEMVLFYDPKEQENFRSTLDKSNIQCRLDDDGAVWYKLKDRNRVELIEHEITLKYKFQIHSISYPNDDEAALFVNELEVNNIGYISRVRHGMKWYVWDEKDDFRVRSIRELVARMILEKRRNKRLREKGAVMETESSYHLDDN
ncbi:MAG: hypothetical protein L3J89_13620 [Gammaproteobacteria bacterium]|nr:hypothetical protein [Gammaproteobacteria bacterium]